MNTLDDSDIEAVKKAVEKIGEEFDLEFAVLAEMGNGTSDHDKEKFLLIVSEDFASIPPKERITLLSKYLRGLELDVYPHTLLEFKNLIKRYQGYVFEAIEHGIVLKDKGIFNRVRDAVKNNLRTVVIDPETIWELY